MSYCIRTDKIIVIRRGEKYNSYTITLIKLVLEEINSHICGLGLFSIHNPETFCVLVAQTSNKTRTCFLSLNCLLSRKFSNPCLHSCVKESQASYLRCLSC